jgi:hypothetical protein
MRRFLLIFVILAATSLSAGPVILSVSPSEGSVQGGTTVTLTGTGFNDTCIICSPMFGGLSVYFGNTQVPSAHLKLINPTKLEIIAPPHPPGPVSITIRQLDGSDPSSFTLPNAFTYTGDWEAAYEPVLFPIFAPPIRGAFGSEFHTIARIASAGAPFDIFGVDTNCTTIDPPILPDRPFRIGAEEFVLPTTCSRTTGRLFFVPTQNADDLASNLRVTDVSRLTDNHGVQIPVVRLRDFTSGSIKLLGVPVEARYRNTLRIYGLPGGSQSVNVTVFGTTTTMQLRPGSSIYEPSYAEYTNLPTSLTLPQHIDTMTVTIAQPAGSTPTAIWAFVSVTNNESQQITLVTP